MMKRDVPVYLITGFLESGKTQFLDFTIHQSYFQIPDKTLLILCEEGEEEYDEESLKKMNTVIEIIEDPEDFNADTLQMLNKKHHPGRVLVEYNPLWSVDKFYQTDMPRYWDLAQHIVTVDASTFQIYMNNMKSLFMEMIRNADLVIFNRCQDEHPLANFRRSVKVVNSRAEVVFENEEGEIDDIFQDEMPYDMNADIIDIEDIDYGIWYVDMMDNLKKYVDKTVRFKGQVLKSRELNAGFFVPGRMAMTCCADDTQFIGYICKNPAAKRLRIGSWVTVTAKVKDEFMEVYNGRGPVLYATEIERQKNRSRSWYTSADEGVITMYLIVGLGNPGKQYENTRHNVGFDAVDLLVDEYRVPSSGKQHKAMYGKGVIAGQKVILAKPLTYMNLSGESVRALVDYYKIDPEEELIVIYDDISLEPGKIRIRKKGSAGGHNGIKNIIAQLGTQNFQRIKVGVGEKPKGWDLADYVLGHFSKEDRGLVDDALKRAAGAVELMVQGEVDQAMNQFN